MQILILCLDDVLIAETSLAVAILWICLSRLTIPGLPAESKFKPQRFDSGSPCTLEDCISIKLSGRKIGIVFFLLMTRIKLLLRYSKRLFIGI